MRKQLLFSIPLALGLSFWGACSSTDNGCEGPGDCPAGAICTNGECEAVRTPTVDAGSVDAGMSLYDAGPRHDTGPAFDAGPYDSGAIVADSGGSGPPLFDAGPLPDLGAELFEDVGIPEVLTLGDPCQMPDVDAGEPDPCSIDNPNFFCFPSVNGQTAYCSSGCAYEPEDHHGGEDAGPHEHDEGCGSGCCMLIEPDRPGELPESYCRFAPDCQ